MLMKIDDCFNSYKDYTKTVKIKQHLLIKIHCVDKGGKANESG